MPIIIDTNTIPKVFNHNDSEHPEFKPVFDWINTGNGKIVYGGTKYLRELNAMPSYEKLMKLYSDRRKVNLLNLNDVDQKEIEIINIKPNAAFNDHHLIAIALVSRCNLICTNNHRHIPFLKNRIFYPKGFRPKFYTRSIKKHRDLLR